MVLLGWNDEMMKSKIVKNKKGENVRVKSKIV